MVPILGAPCLLGNMCEHAWKHEDTGTWGQGRKPGSRGPEKCTLEGGTGSREAWGRRVLSGAFTTFPGAGRGCWRELGRSEE